MQGRRLLQQNEHVHQIGEGDGVDDSFHPPFGPAGNRLRILHVRIHPGRFIEKENADELPRLLRRFPVAVEVPEQRARRDPAPDLADLRLVV